MEQVVQSLIAVNLLPDLHGLAENDDINSIELFRHPESPFPPIGKIPDKIEKLMELCPDSTQLNFAKTEYWLKQVVFWFTIPLLTLYFVLFCAMLVYIFTR